MKKLCLTLLVLTTLLNFCFSQTNTFPASGNVGIGTTTPVTPLDVTGNLTLENPNDVPNAGAIIQFTSLNTNYPGPTIKSALQLAGAHIYNNLILSSYWDGYKNELTLTNGNVGIGTTTPATTLDVNGTGNFTGNLTTGIFANATNTFQEVLASFYYGISGVSYPGQFRWYTSPNNSLYKTNALYQLRAWDNGSNTENTIMTITGGGDIGIGTTHPQYPLDVYGIMHAQQVNVDMSGVPDYVFNKDYHLPTLTETAAYIDKNHHLSEIPSAAEITKNGLNLGEMNKLLLKKVEELTLYLIEKDKQVSGQQKTTGFGRSKI